MSFVTTKSTKTATRAAHLTDADQAIIDAYRNLGEQWHNKAIAVAKDTESDFFPDVDSIHRYITQSRSYHNKAYSHERRCRVAYEELNKY